LPARNFAHGQLSLQHFGSAHLPLSADALSSALGTILSVTDEGSTSSFSTRFPLIAQPRRVCGERTFGSSACRGA
jgi:hypothetical protein